MSDIVERLREQSYPVSRYDSKILSEAANRIEALEAQVVALTKPKAKESESYALARQRQGFIY